MRRKVSKIHRAPGFFLGCVLLALLAYLLGWSSLLAANTVNISGTTRVADVTSLLDSMPSTTYRKGAPLARIDTRYINRKLKSLDWIKNSRTSRDWLHQTLSISIIERTPIAQFIDEKGQLRLIDKTGVDFLSPSAIARYPTITFAEPTPELKNAISLFLQSIPEGFISSLNSLAIRAPLYIQSQQKGLGAGMLIIRWGDTSDLAVKVKVIQRLLSLDENKKAKLIDVISPLTPIVK